LRSCLLREEGKGEARGDTKAIRRVVEGLSQRRLEGRGDTKEIRRVVEGRSPSQKYFPFPLSRGRGYRG